MTFHGRERTGDRMCVDMLGVGGTTTRGPPKQSREAGKKSDTEDVLMTLHNSALTGANQEEAYLLSVPTEEQTR